MQVLPTICAILYFLGAFLYYLHQITILYFKEVDDYSEAKVLTNAVIWPWRTLEIVVDYVITMNKRDDEDDE
jgi:hypothetical protein